MKAAIALQAPNREAECSYDFEADIYSAPRGESVPKLLPAVLPALLVAVFAVFRLR